MSDEEIKHRLKILWIGYMALADVDDEGVEVGFQWVKNLVQ